MQSIMAQDGEDGHCDTGNEVVGGNDGRAEGNETKRRWKFIGE